MNKTIDIYLTRQQSNSIKAIVMLLIILGHNHILVPNNESSVIFDYLYHFHVSIFFMLPFFYEKNDILNRDTISKIIVRNGIPYLLYFFFCYMVYHFLLIKNGFNFYEFFGGLLNLPGYNVKNTTGFVFLWFLPVFMLMSLCKLLGDRYKWLRITFFLIGFLFCINWKAYAFMWHAPFYILRSLFYYSIGICAYYLCRYIKNINYIGMVSFIILTIFYWLNLYKANYFYFSLSAFFLLRELTLRLDFSKIPYLFMVGKYSLPIYLMHVFIYNVMERIFPNTLFWGIMIYFMTIGLSLFASVVIYKVEVVRSFLFPKSWKEWIHFYQTAKRKD